MFNSFFESEEAKLAGERVERERFENNIGLARETLINAFKDQMPGENVYIGMSEFTISNLNGLAATAADLPFIDEKFYEQKDISELLFDAESWKHKLDDNSVEEKAKSSIYYKAILNLNYVCKILPMNQKYFLADDDIKIVFKDLEVASRVVPNMPYLVISPSGASKVRYGVHLSSDSMVSFDFDLLNFLKIELQMQLFDETLDKPLIIKVPKLLYSLYNQKDPNYKKRAAIVRVYHLSCLG